MAKSVMVSFSPITSLWGFFRRSMAAYSVVDGQKRDGVVFPHYKSMGCFPTLKGSLLRSRWSDLVEIRTYPRYYACPHYLQVWNRSDQCKLATEKMWWHRHSKAANSVVSGGIWRQFKLIQAFIHVLFTCKNAKDPKRCDVVFPIISR